MNEFKNWTEVTTKMFRYALAPGAAYEIIITYWAQETPLGTAKANLYSTGYWVKESVEWFERELIAEGLPIQECIAQALDDLKENDLPSYMALTTGGPVDLSRDE